MRSGMHSTQRGKTTRIAVIGLAVAVAVVAIGAYVLHDRPHLVSDLEQRVGIDLSPLERIAGLELRRDDRTEAQREAPAEEHEAPRELAEERVQDHIREVEELRHELLPGDTAGEFVTKDRPITLPAPEGPGLRDDEGPGGVQAYGLLTEEGYRTVTVEELLQAEGEIPEDTLFYVHSVTEDDTRGVWGIMHQGLVERFAKGIAIKQGDEIRSLQVKIPEDADRRLPDGYSSFLGQLLYMKAMDSYVYNYHVGSMGRNPDLIHPGQEIVITGFSADELVAVYEYFLES